MPTSVVKVVELSRNVVNSKRDNARLVRRNADLVKALEDGRSLERLMCDKLGTIEDRV